MTSLELTAVGALVLGIVNTVAIVFIMRASVSSSALGTRSGLPLGSALPAFVTSGLNSEGLTDADARGRVLLFLGANCRPCHAVARELQTLEGTALPPLLIGILDKPAGHFDDLATVVGSIGVPVFRDPTRDVADRSAVPGTPFAYAIDSSGRVRAKTPATSVERLRSIARFASS